MKVFIVLAIFLTLVAIFFMHRKNKNLKKLLIALATFGAIISLAVLGNLSRQIMPIFIIHNVLLLFSWVALIAYLLRDRYYWWIIFSPLLTIGLFLLLELLTGSSHEPV
ncbi:hypothetical protein [Sulfurovum sp.]|uniref:hypothetical protein n=1 Tax=Sulfurovum sp. TaxID=1969726 RepID=UPI002867D35D|nr:hypothetical protein [Sulfurovum sp.]